MKIPHATLLLLLSIRTAPGCLHTDTAATTTTATTATMAADTIVQGEAELRDRTFQGPPPGEFVPGCEGCNNRSSITFNADRSAEVLDEGSDIQERAVWTWDANTQQVTLRIDRSYRLILTPTRDGGLRNIESGTIYTPAP